MNTPQHAAARPLGKEHIPRYPPRFISIRVVQLVLGLLVLALAAYGISYVAFDGNSFILAVAIMTLVSSIYHLVAHWGVPALYNYWAILGLDILLVVMWLCSFALLAARIAAVYAYVDDYYGSYSYYGSGYGLSSSEDALLITQALAAALGGVEFALYIVSLVIHSIRLHRHRAAGLHCMPATSPTTPSRPPGPAAAAAAPYGGVPAPMYQPPFPAHQHHHHQQQQQQQQQQQPLPAYGQQGSYYAQQPEQGYMVPVAKPMSMPMPGQQMMIAASPQQQQQQQVPPHSGFYAPSPSQSPPPPQPIVPQPAGQSQATTSPGAQQQQMQGQQVEEKEEKQLPPQLPGDEPYRG
ncbi:hypothetical protein N657DRAFT_667471 [Parathielavia appendiculata]|uniref:MARVEL domain-containing protein n=1 Tax=Parathielavia appendiculata TaxID=2587402 RepID=A0AAN6Z8F8_9PEZI|nr:hypothetical protein N657DRAFT_667471 [Parathielavia appendiculata]